MKKNYQQIYRNYQKGNAIRINPFLLMKKVLLFVCMLMLTSYSVYANNIAISNINFIGQNHILHYTMVQFDVSWENSWRISGSDPYNWDAAWVFIKYRVNATSGGDGLWRHATINTTGSVAPTGSTISVSSDSVGAFIYRSTNGTGTFTVTGSQLQWNYGLNKKNVTDFVGDSDIVDIRLFAIEMVYVPQGSFYAGDGFTSTTFGVFGRFMKNTSSTAYQITSESEPSILGGPLSSTSNLHNNNAQNMDPVDDFNNSTTQTLPGAYPKGYNAFYCMKYEISQQQFVNFLNTLTYTQQVTRTPISPDSTAGSYFFNESHDNYRHRIKISTPGIASTTPAVYATDNPYVSCEYISCRDMMAYFDWSGLRPMTELEYEKSCRGTLLPVSREYAWGNTNIIIPASINNAGNINETATNSNANCVCSSSGVYQYGPMRVGCLATSSSNRISSGATYYGIMDMSGNTFERVITLGSNTGRIFTGTHGNGILNSNGYADVPTWPPSYVGIGARGGAWNDYIWSNGEPTCVETSDRYKAVGYTNVGDNRYAIYGGRGLRTAP
jgi:formylglycine-generating enzyme required for sulfatase activity